MDHGAGAAARCAVALLAALDEAQIDRARGSLDDPRFTEWTYLPGDRPGLSLEDLTAAQHTLVLELLHASHSSTGAELAVGAIEVERIRRRLVTATPVTGDRYWVRVLGDPVGDGPWGWRINGHHLAVHAVVFGDRMTLTPHFIGSEPAVVPTGSATGRRLLGLEEDLARELVAGMDPDQTAIAISADQAPRDILTRADPVADPTLLPSGIAHGQLRPDQQDLLDRLIHRYLNRAPSSYAEQCWREAEEAGLDRIRFAWAGPFEPGEGHYYCVRTPHFLIEYDNTQDNANHAHSVWRHLRDDWGWDLLRDHYAHHHAR